MNQPHCAQAAPYEVDLEEGQNYYWCTCGLSQNQPFCDGAHKGSGFKSQCFSVEATGKVWLCGCKQSKNPPFCDESHKELDRPHSSDFKNLDRRPSGEPEERILIRDRGGIPMGNDSKT